MKFEHLRKYVPLAVWTLALGALLLIPLKIASYGYLPNDDVLRHAAKAVSGKAWTDILVMRPGFSMDHNFGWHRVLGWVQRFAGSSPDGLAAFSIIGLLLAVLMAPLIGCRRPEAWLATLLAFCVALPYLIGRLTLGRPFLITMAVMMGLLFFWKPRDNRPNSTALWLGTTLAIALAVWIHGAWYLLALPVVAFYLAGQWRDGIALTGCWLAGAVLGAALTGHPWQFLWQALAILFNALGQPADQRLLVLEFRPFDGDFSALVIIGLCAWYRLRKGGGIIQILRDPIFMLMAIAWLAGLRVQRFWMDWGLPAALMWCLEPAENFFKEHLPPDSFYRVYLASFLAAGLLFVTTSDLGSRWTSNLTAGYLEAENPALQGWLPDKDGILYSNDMTVFYRTFFKNPRAPWKYILGFEPTFMPEADLKILRNIQWNHSAAEAFAPWVEKMRPIDRLAVPGIATIKPGIPQLEWNYAVSGLWIGRLPQAPASR